MIIARSVQDVRKQVKEWHAQGLTVGLVPTMGALHEGHASLVTAAVEQCDRVVASIFVNPTQFGENEDLDSYPRTFEADRQVLTEKGCHMVFHPSVGEVYPQGYATYVTLDSEMTRQLCGKSRPIHFQGVCTIVSKLFNIVTPDKAFFGEKDAQQLAVIKQMVRDMNFDIEIIGCPIVREADGLAKSSRNAYLNGEERQAALVLHRALEAARGVIAGAKAVGAAAEAGVKAAGGVGTAGILGSASSADSSQSASSADGSQSAGSAGSPQKAGSTESLQSAETPSFSIPAEAVLSVMNKIVSAEPLAKIDYIEVVDGVTMMPVDNIEPGNLVAMAVYIGKTRLIDNFTVR